MKRTPLARKTSLRRTRIRPRNPERAAQALARDFGPQAGLCRSLPCVACWGVDTMLRAAEERLHGDSPSLWCGSDPHHEPPRSCGGTDRDTIPLCRVHHERRHSEGRDALESSIRAKTGIRDFGLVDAAARLATLLGADRTTS